MIHQMLSEQDVTADPTQGRAAQGAEEFGHGNNVLMGAHRLPAQARTHGNDICGK